MPYCPKCKAEYQESIDHCPECGTSLFSGLSTVARNTDEELVNIYSPVSQVQSQMLKTALESAGISVLEQVDRAHFAYDDIDLSVVGRYSCLFVMKSKVEQAQQVIADTMAAFKKEELALTPEEIEKLGSEAVVLQPHRGRMIFAQGLLAAMLSFVYIGLLFGLAAVIFGFKDLAKMRQGSMDKGGSFLTIGGLILAFLGIIASLVSILMYFEWL